MRTLSEVYAWFSHDERVETVMEIFRGRYSSEEEAKQAYGEWMETRKESDVPRVEFEEITELAKVDELKYSPPSSNFDGRYTAEAFKEMYPDEYKRVMDRAISLTAIPDALKSDADKVFELRVANGRHFGELFIQKGIDLYENWENVITCPDPHSFGKTIVVYDPRLDPANYKPNYEVEKTLDGRTEILVSSPRYHVCFYCGQRNTLSNLYCEHCGAPLEDDFRPIVTFG